MSATQAASFRRILLYALVLTMLVTRCSSGSSGGASAGSGIVSSRARVSPSTMTRNIEEENGKCLYKLSA